MKFKFIFLLCFYFARIHPLTDYKELSNTAGIVLTPGILGTLTSQFTDEDDHINGILGALSAGTLLASFEQLASKELQFIKIVPKAIRNSISLLILERVHKIIKRDKERQLKQDELAKNDEKSEEQKEKVLRNKNYRFQNLENYFQFFGIVNESFAGEITKHIFIYQAANLLLSKIIPFLK